MTTRAGNKNDVQNDSESYQLRGETMNDEIEAAINGTRRIDFPPVAAEGVACYHRALVLADEVERLNKLLDAVEKAVPWLGSFKCNHCGCHVLSNVDADGERDNLGDTCQCGEVGWTMEINWQRNYEVKP